MYHMQGRRKVKMFGGPVLIDLVSLESWSVHFYIDSEKLWGGHGPPGPPGSAGPDMRQLKNFLKLQKRGV